MAALELIIVLIAILNDVCNFTLSMFDFVAVCLGSQTHLFLIFLILNILAHITF